MEPGQRVQLADTTPASVKPKGTGWGEGMQALNG